MKMIHLALVRSPLLMFSFPFTKINYYDKPVSEQVKPLVKDELGWDKVKRIFRLNEEGMFTKELQSIISITLSGGVAGAMLGGLLSSKETVNKFIANNEATRFMSQMDAKWHLQQAVSIDFIKKGGKLGAKVALFCFMFSTVTTCMTAYRGKLTMGNYILGGSLSGMLFKMNLGLRAAISGTVLGGILGGVCGSMTISILYLSGISMDEVLEVQQKWITSKNDAVRENIKIYMESKGELAEAKQIYEENKQIRQENVKDHKT